MKPTLNAISAEGVKVVSLSIDTCGFFARTVEDLRLIADLFAITGEEHPVAGRASGEISVAFVKTPMWAMAERSTKEAMGKAARILDSHGIKVEEVELPEVFGDASSLKRTHKTVLNSEARSAFLVEYRMDRTKLNPKIRGFVENVSNFSRTDVVEAEDKYATMRTTFDKFAASFDAIITPSATDVAPVGLGDMGDSSFNFLWTVSS